MISEYTTIEDGKELPSTNGNKDSLRNNAECAERGIREDIPKLYEREREREYKIIWNYQTICVKRKKVVFSLQHVTHQRVFGARM